MGLHVNCAVCPRSFKPMLLTEADGEQRVSLEEGWREVTIRLVLVSGTLGDERRLYVHSDDCEAELRRRTRMGKLLPSRQDLAERLLNVTCDRCGAQAFARFTRVATGKGEVSRLKLADGWRLVQVTRRVASGESRTQNLYACSEDCELLLEILPFETT